MLFSNSKVTTFPQIYKDPNEGNGPSNPSLKFPLECINSSKMPFIKFLGVYFDPMLTFKNHASHVTKKLSTALYFLRTAKNVLNQRALKSIYYAIFHSHLVYAIHLWSCCSESTLKPIII